VQLQHHSARTPPRRILKGDIPEPAMKSIALPLACALLLSACATFGGDSDIPEDAVETTRTEPNGDQVTEFRVDGRLRALKVVPSRGPTYYLYDRNGDGVVDEERDGVQPVYFKLFEWD
jgi:hypothetical protein